MNVVVNYEQEDLILIDGGFCIVVAGITRRQIPYIVKREDLRSQRGDIEVSPIGVMVFLRFFKVTPEEMFERLRGME